MMHVVATAGHVDHGKSTLLRALTGMEPDRWPQERERGMTIDLGFVWASLPSGERIAFVDVPGHERFVANMLAGVGAVPAVLFVVAADEGWMPQSGEHLAALDALGVANGLLVVTRSDRADPELALAEAREYLRGTALADIRGLAVSAVTGEGLELLRTALDEMTAGLPAPDTTAPIRLWVDRAFTVRGSGTVVTATLGAGTIKVGDALHCGPKHELRVRSIQTLHEPVDEVSAVARVAVNLRGPGREQLGRGIPLVTPDQWEYTALVDCWLDRAPGQDPAADGIVPVGALLHIGSARVPVRVRPLGPSQADRTAVRLTLATALPLHVGDRALLRDPSQVRGSTILGRLTVLDVRPPGLRRRGDASARGGYLRSLPAVPDGRELLAQRGFMRRRDVITMGCRPPAPPLVGDWLVDGEAVDRLRRRLVDEVARYEADHPLETGMPVDATRNALGLPDRRIVEALVIPPLQLTAGRISAGIHALPDDVAAAVATVRAALSSRPFRAPEQEHLAALRLDRRALAAAERQGALLRVADGVVLLPGADREAARILLQLPQPFTVAAAREALESTRRVVVPLLEHLDRCGYTEQVGDSQRRCRAERISADDLR